MCETLPEAAVFGDGKDNVENIDEADDRLYKIKSDKVAWQNRFSSNRGPQDPKPVVTGK